ncbi:MAG: hypothetical protein ACRBN8_43920 [Nannocystales bacterium]
MPRPLATLPCWLAAVLMLGCPVEYTVPLETEGGTSQGQEADQGETSQPTEDNDTGDCLAPNLACEDGCIDPESDSNHCGDCDRGCGAGGTCIEAQCVDSCGNACDLVTEVCSSGSCECRPGFDRCDGACVDLDTNAAHCGECGEVCAEDEKGEIELYLCEAGDCHDEDVTCARGLTECGQSCVDLESHPLHCDACNRSCDGDQVCIEGECLDA